MDYSNKESKTQILNELSTLKCAIMDCSNEWDKKN